MRFMMQTLVQAQCGREINSLSEVGRRTVNRHRSASQASIEGAESVVLRQCEGVRKMQQDLTKIILELGLATLLFGSGIWATLSGGSLSQNKDASR